MSASAQLYDLLARRSTEGLSGGDAMTLEQLLGSQPEIDPESFDHAASAIHEALIPRERRLPDAVRARLLELSQPSAPFEAPSVDIANGAEDTSDLESAPSTSNFGWWAAAAMLALALIGWWPRLSSPPASEVSSAAPTAAVGIKVPELRDTLLGAAGSVTLPWAVTEDPTATGASGDVVWNTDRQQGVMRFAGLEVNDPTEYQYQLWIFDKQRDERYPVDGGVFDVTSETGEVLVEIEAKVSVDEPYLFAVTVERPGGVVVSSRERIALLAQPS